MYKIIGADQKEYGPATIETLREWIASGRANGQTLVQPAGATEWKPLAEYPELAALLMPVKTAEPEPRPSTDSPDILRRVQAPAIFLLIVGILTILEGITNLVSHVFSASGGFYGPFRHPDVPPELQRALPLLVGVPTTLLSIALAAVSLFGALSMMKLRHYGFALAGAILMLVPCNCCCGLGLASGIWAIIVLTQPEVKAAFQP